MVSSTTELFIYLCTAYGVHHHLHRIRKNGQMTVATTSRVKTEKYVQISPIQLNRGDFVVVLCCCCRFLFITMVLDDFLQLRFVCMNRDNMLWHFSLNVFFFSHQFSFVVMQILNGKIILCCCLWVYQFGVHVWAIKSQPSFDRKAHKTTHKYAIHKQPLMNARNLNGNKTIFLIKTNGYRENKLHIFRATE